MSDDRITDAQVKALLESFAEDAAAAPPGSCPTPEEQLRRGRKALQAALSVDDEMGAQ